MILDNLHKNDTRTVMVLWVWITYILMTVLYFITFGNISPVYSKLIYSGAGFFTLCYCANDILYGFKHELHRGLLAVSIFSVALTFFLILIYYCIGIENYKIKISTFMTVELITAIFIYRIGKKRNML